MWIEVFKAGEQTDSAGNTRVWSEADLAEIAQKYNKQSQHEAPVTVGHPKDNSPAYGWVDELKAVGDTLYAKFRDVEEQFKKMVNDKRFPKRSIALYDDGLLRHIGFLGAVPPAIKGMPDAQFSGSNIFSEYEAEFCGACQTEPAPAKQPTNPAASAKGSKQEQTFSARQARSAVWGISPKETGFDTVPDFYKNLQPENFADPVNLRFPLDKQFMPAVLGTWKRNNVRAQYTEQEQNIISARLAKAAMHYGYKLGEASFLEVPAELLTKNQLVKVVTGATQAPASSATAPSQPAQSNSQSSKFTEEGVMPPELLQQLFEELLAFASETFGEEAANQMAAKVQELQDKYNKMAADQAAASGAAGANTPANGAATAMNELQKQFSEEKKLLNARIEQLEAESLLNKSSQFCEELIQRGALTTGQKDSALELLIASSSIKTEMNFSEVVNNTRKPVKKNLNQAFRDFLGSLKQIEYGEQAGNSRAGANDDSPANEFSDAPPDRLALHQKIVAFQEEQAKQGNKLTYSQALRHVTRKESNNG